METIQFIPVESQRMEAVKAIRSNSIAQKVFLILIIAALIWLVCSWFVMNACVPSEITAVGPTGKDSGIIRNAMVLCLVLLVGVTPLISLLRIRWQVVDKPIKSRQEERVVLTDVAIECSFYYNKYQRQLEHAIHDYHYTSIRYQDITRIELYEDVQAIKVFGKVHICSQPGAPTEQNTLRIIDDPDKAYRVFFLYYHDADKLVQLLSERSGQPVIRLPQCTGTLQEKN